VLSFHHRCRLPQAFRITKSAADRPPRGDDPSNDRRSGPIQQRPLWVGSCRTSGLWVVSDRDIDVRRKPTVCCPNCNIHSGRLLVL